MKKCLYSVKIIFRMKIPVSCTIIHYISFGCGSGEKYQIRIQLTKVKVSIQDRRSQNTLSGFEFEIDYLVRNVYWILIIKGDLKCRQNWRGKVMMDFLNYRNQRDENNNTTWKISPSPPKNYCRNTISSFSPGSNLLSSGSTSEQSCCENQKVTTEKTFTYRGIFKGSLIGFNPQKNRIRLDPDPA